ncbi:MAG: glycosyltransferase family 39 protein [Ardenticatenaceae bacterium]|nr:glycosyltransferase family 39 protein [Ardenticatenaceae bacterium]
MLRLSQLGLQPLWWDEGYSAYLATERPAHTVALTSVDIHPPLYYLLLHAWFALLGAGVTSARLLSVVLGVAAVPLFWAVARRLVGRRAAWVATALFAVAPLHIYYSQEVRMYALLTLLALLAVWAVLTERRWLAALALLAALFTHYYAAFLLLALAGAVLWRGWCQGRPGSAMRRWAGPVALVALGYLPWLLYAGPRLYRYVGGKLVIEADAPMTPLQFPWRHLVAFSLGHLMPSQRWLAPAALIFLALAVLGVRELKGTQENSGEFRRVRAGSSVLWAWLVVPLVGAFLVNLVAPFTDARIERQLIFADLPFEMLVGAGIPWLWSRRRVLGGMALGAVLLASTLSLVGFYTIPRYPDDDYRPIIATVAARQSPGDGWLAIYPWQIGYLRVYLPHRHPEIISVPLAWADNASARRMGVADLLATHQRLWFPAFQIKGRLFEGRLAATLAGIGVPVWDDWFGNTRLWLMAPATVGEFKTTRVVFEGGLQLTTLAIEDRPVASGVGVVPILLGFEGPTEGVRASVQLSGAGSVWGEWDGPLAALVRVGLPVDPGTPPGSYEAHLTVYRAGSGAPLEHLETGTPAGTTVPIGLVVVERPASALSPTALPVTVGRPAALGETVRFVGAAIATDSIQTGDDLPVTLFWQAAADVGRDLRVFVQLLDDHGVVRGASDIPPVGGHFPTSRWRRGDLIRDPHRLPVAADAWPGRYRLIAGLYDPATGMRLKTTNGADHLELGVVMVAARPHVFEPPAVALPAEVSLGSPGVARLVGATVEWPGPPGEAVPGSTLRVTLVWQPEQSPPTRLRAFVQLLDAANQVGGLSDGPPGEAPSTAWLSGEYITDHHTLAVRPEAHGRYRLIAGLYDLATGARLTTPDGADFIVLGEVAVR